MKPTLLNFVSDFVKSGSIAKKLLAKLSMLLCKIEYLMPKDRNRPWREIEKKKLLQKTQKLANSHFR